MNESALAGAALESSESERQQLAGQLTRALAELGVTREELDRTRVQTENHAAQLQRQINALRASLAARGALISFGTLFIALIFFTYFLVFIPLHCCFLVYLP